MEEMGFEPRPRGLQSTSRLVGSIRNMRFSLQFLLDYSPVLTSMPLSWDPDTVLCGLQPLLLRGRRTLGPSLCPLHLLLPTSWWYHFNTNRVAFLGFRRCLASGPCSFGLRAPEPTWSPSSSLKHWDWESEAGVHLVLPGN